MIDNKFSVEKELLLAFFFVCLFSISTSNTGLFFFIRFIPPLNI